MSLGTKIVRELKLHEGDDTLGKWMAHHIAGLMQDAQTATGNERAVFQEECANAIHKLWNQLHKNPNGPKPLEDFDPILRTLESLDLETDTPRYVRAGRWEAESQEADCKSAEWLLIANGIDRAAKTVIRVALSNAIKTASSTEAKEWLSQATAANAMEDDYLVAIKIVATTSDRDKEDGLSEQRTGLQKKLDHLNALVGLSKEIRQTIEKEIKDLE